MALLPRNMIDPGQKQPAHQTTFVKSQMSTGNSNRWNLVGYVTADGRPIPQEYLITVTSIRNKCSIVAPMQEPIRMEVESRWDPFIPSSILNEGNIIAQAMTRGKTSLVTRASSRRIWQGSSPVRLNLRMKFQAVENAMREVVEPIRLMQSIALPSEPRNNGKGADVGALLSAGKDLLSLDLANSVSHVNQFLSTVPLVSPPGPTPFSVEGILDLGEASTGQRNKENEIREGLMGGDIIVIEIGRFLTFYNVIVNRVVEEVPIMMTADGDPVSATVDIVFETYEMITTEELARMYTKNILSGAK